MSQVEHGATIGLVDVDEPLAYSVFVLSPFGLVGPAAADDIRTAAGRPDVTLEWLEPESAHGWLSGKREPAHLVSCIDDRVVPYRPVSPESSGSARSTDGSGNPA